MHGETVKKAKKCFWASSSNWRRHIVCPAKHAAKQDRPLF